MFFLATGSAATNCSLKTVDPNSFSSIYEVLHSASDEWYNIAIKLGADHQVLAKIRKHHHDHSERCLQETLDYLFKQTNPPTMKDVIEALESPLVDNKCLATVLREKFVK